MWWETPFKGVQFFAAIERLLHMDRVTDFLSPPGLGDWCLPGIPSPVSCRMDPFRTDCRMSASDPIAPHCVLKKCLRALSHSGSTTLRVFDTTSK